ncbi:alpha/beta hydrolase [Akkermansiaceae bacterium]|nr:alpha/beta hydrolase [Akkermansiaceae bacterium]
MMIRSVLVLLLVTLGLATAAEPLRDVKYDDKHERNVLDFWPALKSDKAAPVFVWFHGGGFRNGDKTQLEKKRKVAIDTYRKAGYAVVSCNYPFLARDMDYRQIAHHCARAVQFIRSKPEESINRQSACEYP